MNPGYHRILGALRDLRTDWRWWLSFVLPVRMTSTYTALRPSEGALDNRRGPVHVYDWRTGACSCKGYGDLPVTERATWWQWRGRVFARAVEVIDV